MRASFRYLVLVMLALPAGRLSATSFAYATNCCTSGSSISIVNNVTAMEEPGLPLEGTAVGVVMSLDGSTVYGATQNPNMLTVISVASQTIQTQSFLVVAPTSLALSPDGSTLYVGGCLSTGDCAVEVRNTATLATLAVIGIGQPPASLAITPNGSQLYATVHPPGRDHHHGLSTVSSPTGSGIVAIDTSTNSVSGFLPMLQYSPSAIQIMPSGTMAYIADSAAAAVYAFDLVRGRVTATIPLGSVPAALALSSNGGILYASAESLYAISTGTNDVLNHWFIDYATAGLAVSQDGIECYVADYYLSTIDTFNLIEDHVTARVSTGFHPISVVLTPDGTVSFSANAGSSTVSQIDESRNVVAGQIEAGAEPYAVALSPDGSTIYAANFYSSNLSVISAATLQRVVNIPTGRSPRAVVASPDGTRVYTSNSDATVTVIDTASNTVVGTIRTAPDGQTLAYDLAISPDGSTLYALTNYVVFAGIVIIDTRTDAISGGIRLNGDLGNIAVSPDGRNAYVSGNTSQGYLIAVDLTRGTQLPSIPVYKPFGVKVSPDGLFIYTGTTDHPSINTLVRATGRVISTVPVDGVAGLALNANGSRLYVSGPELTVFDTASQSVLTTINTYGPTLGVSAQ
jgi:YVTN family beta-propeller protein